MRNLLLTTTLLTLAASAHAQQIVTPGAGTITDASGNTWQIVRDGSVLENGSIWTPGGGGTAALTISNGIVYGEDFSGRGWFALNRNYWTTSPAPPNAPSQAPAASPVAAQPATASSTPAVPLATCAATPGGAATGGFTVSNGQFIAPDGSVFIAKGIDVYNSDMGSASQILSMFPGLNFVRLNVYSYGSPSSYQGFISTMTGAGVVVMVDWHVGAGGGVAAPTGSALTAETQWFASMAAAYKSNPSVWFNTLNEPANSSQTWAEQAAVYQAIRGAGSNAIILLEWAGQTDGSYASGMTNVGVDQHFYGWESNYSTNQATVTASMTSNLQQVRQAFGNLPVLIGEYGISTDGNTVDPNGNQVVTAVTGSGIGSAAWNWDSGAPSDNLTQGGSMTSYGQMVAGYIALVNGAAASVWAAVCPTATAAASTTTAQAASITDPSATTAATDPIAQAQPDVTAAETDAQQQVDQIQSQTPAIDSAIAATQARIQALEAQKAAQQ